MKKAKKKELRQKKITLFVPEDLLAQALDSSGEGIAATVKQGLSLIAARHAYERMRELRGRVKVSIDLKALRAD